MGALEQLLVLFVAAVLLAAAARRVGAPYPVFLALGGALLAFVPAAPSFTLRVNPLRETAPPDVPPGLPAALLARRPDVASAEQRVVAANAQIGVAKADFYPRFSLFGSVGTQTSQLGDLFSGSSFFYSFGPRLLWPLFNYGRIKNNVRVEDARYQQSLVIYEDTVLRAAQGAAVLRGEVVESGHGWIAPLHWPSGRGE